LPLTNEATIGTIWSANVGAGGAGEGASLRPRIDANTVYAADVKGRVSALEAATGRQVWKVDIDQEITGGPGSGDGLVLVARWTAR